MKHTTKKLPKSQVELTISVTPEECKKHMEKAATKISARTSIKGFRKGKAPYDMVKREVGEMNILNEALEGIVHESFYKAVTEENLETIGMPEIKIEKVAPGNDVEYVATVALLPNVKLADLSKINVERKEKEITDAQVDEMIENLRGMQSKEVLKDGVATKEDMIEIDMDLKVDNVPIEGGQAKGYRIYLSEKDRHIPGFNDELIGLKAGDEKTFTLPFPETYYKKSLAGKPGTFEITVKGVYTRELPTVDEAFAKTLGQSSVEELKKKLKENLALEEGRKADQRAEEEIFDTTIEKSTFDEIPDVLIDAERKKMFYELQRDLDRNGVSISDYMQSIKKTEEELFEDFKQRAIKRAQASLISRVIAKEQNITISDEELQKEIDMMKEAYKDNAEAQENLKKPEVHDTIRNVEQNKKVVAWLKGQVLKDEKKKKETTSA